MAVLDLNQRLNTKKQPGVQASEKVVWKPLPGAQELFMMLGQPGKFLVKELLFHGTRGNGKSDCLIMGFCQHVGKGWGVHWSGVIFRQEFKSLASLAKTAKEYISKAFPDCEILQNGLEYRFATGESLKLDYIKTYAQYDAKYHGHNIPYIGWDELATWADDELYEAMISVCRTAFQPTREQPNMPPCQIRSATNPYGIGKHWVYKRFIKDRSAGEFVYNEDGSIDRCHLFGTIFENTYIDPAYIENYLKKLVDPMKRAAWLLGDWHAVDRGAFFGRVWDQELVVVPSFKIPSSWRVDRSFDWGQSTPFGTLWVAEADGCEVEIPAGPGRPAELFSPPPGSLIVVAEDYGTEEDRNGEQIKQDAGLYLSASQVAIRIKEKEAGLKSDLLSNVEKVLRGPADNQIYNGSKIQDRKSRTVADLMADEGIKWERSDKSPGSRVHGAQRILEMLHATAEQDPEKPHLYIFDTCKYLIRFLPQLQRDEKQLDAVAKSPDDHLYDVLRYRALHKRKTTKIN